MRRDGAQDSYVPLFYPFFHFFLGLKITDVKTRPVLGFLVQHVEKIGLKMDPVEVPDVRTLNVQQLDELEVRHPFLVFFPELVDGFLQFSSSVFLERAPRPRDRNFSVEQERGGPEQKPP